MDMDARSESESESESVVMDIWVYKEVLGWGLLCTTSSVYYVLRTNGHIKPIYTHIRFINNYLYVCHLQIHHGAAEYTGC